MRQGERATFEQIYRWFERPVFTLALRICGEREQAADVLQDVMLKVIDRIGELRGGNVQQGGSPFRRWLCQIAVNEALMTLRRRRRPGEDGDYLDDIDVIDAPRPRRPPQLQRSCSARWGRCLSTPAPCCGCITQKAVPTSPAYALRPVPQ